MRSGGDDIKTSWAAQNVKTLGGDILPHAWRMRSCFTKVTSPTQRSRMDGAKKRGSRGGSKGGSKGGGKKAKAEDSAATKLRATLSEALAILDWADASEADLETARPQP